MSLIRQFPPTFIWGAATAAYQIEGGWNEGGRGESIWDRYCHTPGKIADGATGDSACNHFHLWKQDVDLMQQLGLKAYRFSISWPRVLPSGRGTPNQKGLHFYEELVDTLLAKGIEPFVTLYHWDLPQELQDAGGWLNRRTIDWFTEYSSLMFRTLGDRVNHWVTINEPNVVAYAGYGGGFHAPGVKDAATAAQVLHHLFVAHGDAVAAGRALLPTSHFSIVPALTMTYPATATPEDAVLAETEWERANSSLLDPLFKGSYPERFMLELEESHTMPTILPGDMERIKQPLDFLGINHYFSHFYTVGANGKTEHVKQDIPYTDLQWPVYPKGLTDLLVRIKKVYGQQPIFITENGCALFDSVSADGAVHDTRRTAYIQGFVRAVHAAIAQGVDVRGYFHWSLMDNFEWAEGYHPRFGLTYVNFTTHQRTIKDSGHAYAEIIKNNGVADVDL